MLTDVIARVHHNKVPRLGEIVEVRCHELAPSARYRKFRVVSYPGFEVRRFMAPFTNGHLVNLEALDNQWPVTVACHLLHVLE